MTTVQNSEGSPPAAEPRPGLEHVELRGTRLAFRKSGTGGEPLLLLHANLSDLRTWEAMTLLLAPHYRVYALARRYHVPNEPLSDDPFDDPWPEHVEDALAFIEQLGLGPTHICGNSSAAFIALLAAKRRPDLVRSAIVEEAPVIPLIFPKLPPSPLSVLGALIRDPRTALRVLHFGATSMGPTIKAFKKGNDERALDLFGRAVFGAWGYDALTGSQRQRMMENLRPHKAVLLGSGLPAFSAADARAIAVPTLLLTSARASSFQRRLHQRLAQLLPQVRHEVVANAGHFIHEDNPRGTADAILRFTTGLPNRA